MIGLRLSQIADIVGGQHFGEDCVVTGDPFSDSRTPVAGGLFVAIVGEHSDGHDYAAGTVAAGAAGVLSSRELPGLSGIAVADTVLALGVLARHVVDTLEPRILALTGSQGKTSTKDYLAQLLDADTIATRGNLNTEIGVPLTVLRAVPTTRQLLLEMGARGIGHIADLCEIAPPDIAAVLNVGTAHVGEFGSPEAIAQAKGEIVEALTDRGIAVLNADDPVVVAMASRTSARVVTFGLAGEMTWRNLEYDDLDRPRFELGVADGSEGWHRVALTQSGAHQVPNAVAAATLARAIGVPLEQAAAGLTAAVAASRWRMERSVRADGLVVINDAYNANPASMRAAIDALTAIGRRQGRRTIAVLGEMKELGDQHHDEHRALGSYALDRGVDRVLVVGTASVGIAETAESISVSVEGRDAAATWLRENVAADDVVLIKASRGAALEALADRLLEGDEEAR